jgi:hypothetical protein
VPILKAGIAGFIRTALLFAAAGAYAQDFAGVIGNHGSGATGENQGRAAL